MWVKICGMTTPEAVAAALQAGADAIGFVFADSPRQLTPADAAQLAAPARGHIKCVAVCRHPGQEAVDEIVREFRPDVLQSDWNDFARLKLPPGLEPLPVLRSANPLPQPLPPRLLFEGPHSGSGVAADWAAATSLARRAQLVLAGGLNPGNVAAAIAAVQPFGVDVSSGVEARRGVKSPAAIVSFVTAARAARAAAGP